MFRWILIGLMFLGVALGADAKTKRALIIGVGDYEQLPDLQKTTGDATGYSEAFEGSWALRSPA